MFCKSLDLGFILTRSLVVSSIQGIGPSCGQSAKVLERLSPIFFSALNLDPSVLDEISVSFSGESARCPLISIYQFLVLALEAGYRN